MRGRMTSTKAISSSRGNSARPTFIASNAPSVPAQDPLLQIKYQELFRTHLDQLLVELFAEVTGLHFHVSWAPPPAREWEPRTLPTGCSVCCQLTGGPQLTDCQSCGPRQLTRTLNADGAGHRFTCRLGVRNYWFPIRIRGATLGIAYLQALNRVPNQATAGKRRARKGPPAVVRTDARALSRLKFARAAKLLRLIVQHVLIASLSDLRKVDLTRARQAVLALEKEQARLHELLKLHLSPTFQAHRHPGPASHADQIIRGLLERIELDYGKPITLQRYARELGMNAAYLSALFSHAVGVPFKTHLTELRLEKAKALLADPARTVANVASTVGYASENRFRIAFKNATGLCPKLWRETMQTHPPPASQAL